MSDEKKPWFDSGFDGAKREQERLDTQYGPRRVWMPDGTSKDLVFVDDTPLCLYEHQCKINNSWQNWYTCIRGVNEGESPTCCDTLGEKSRYYVGYFTVINCTEWKDKKGNKHQYEVQLFPAKLKALKKLKLKKESRGALAGSLFAVARTDKTSAASGDDFDFTREVDMSKLFALANYGGKKLSELFAKAEGNDEAMARLKRLFKVEMADGKLVQRISPFNYEELMAPKQPRELAALLRGATAESDFNDKKGAAPNSGGGGNGTGVPAQDDDVPF